MEKNECKGCIYDLTDRVETNAEKLIVIMYNCFACKRGKKEEYKDDYLDLYKAIEK